MGLLSSQALNKACGRIPPKKCAWQLARLLACCRACANGAASPSYMLDVLHIPTTHHRRAKPARTSPCAV
eukprot:4699010-Prymnesium_polylepis.1